MSRRPARPKTPKLSEIALVAEPLGNASPGRDGCAGCGLWQGCVTPFMRPFIPQGWTGRVLLVGEAPGQHEDEESGYPFTGTAGQLLREMWREAGLKDRDVARVTTCRCRPPKNRAPTMREIRACRPFVLRVIEGLRPRVVIALGATALRGLVNDGAGGNIARARGRDIVVPGLVVTTRVRATYDAAAILRGAVHLRERIVSDLRQAIGEQPFPVYQFPEVGFPSGPVIAVDTEYAPDGELLTLALADPRRADVYEPFASYTRAHVAEHVSKARVLVGHNVAVDLDHLVRLGMARPEWVEGRKVIDTLLLARMVDENKDAYDLETLLLTDVGAVEWKSATKTKKGEAVDARTWSSKERAERCRLDAWGSAVLAETYGESLGLYAGATLTRAPLVEFTHRQAATIHRIYLAGATVDLPEFERLGAQFRAEREQYRDLLTRAARSVGLTEFSPTNDGHIRALLYDCLELPVRARTKSGLPAVDRITLGAYVQNPVVAQLLAFNKADKLVSTWFGGVDRKSKNPPLSELIRPAGVLDGVPVGRIHFRLNPLGTRTGRRSSTPNAQNWPGVVRRIIRSRWPGGRIGNFDYKRLEVVLFAWISGDDKLLTYFLEGDGYIGVGRELWGKAVTKGTREYTVTKSAVLGIQYGMGIRKFAKLLWDVLGVKLAPRWEDHEREAARVYRKYLRAFPGIEAYIAAREDELLRTGRVVSLTGRERRLPCPDGTETPGYGHLRNEAINFPIQSLASDVTGSALVDVERALCAQQGISILDHHAALLAGEVTGTVLINEVHDSLVVDLHPSTWRDDVALIENCMILVPSLRALVPEFTVTLKVDVATAPWWGAED